jgi:hypothetical protein
MPVHVDKGLHARRATTTRSPIGPRSCAAGGGHHAALTSWAAPHDHPAQKNHSRAPPSHPKRPESSHGPPAPATPRQEWPPHPERTTNTALEQSVRAQQGGPPPQPRRSAHLAATEPVQATQSHAAAWPQGNIVFLAGGPTAARKTLQLHKGGVGAAPHSRWTAATTFPSHTAPSDHAAPSANAAHSWGTTTTCERTAPPRYPTGAPPQARRAAQSHRREAISTAL